MTKWNLIVKLIRVLLLCLLILGFLNLLLEQAEEIHCDDTEQLMDFAVKKRNVELIWQQLGKGHSLR